MEFVAREFGFFAAVWFSRRMVLIQKIDQFYDIALQISGVKAADLLHFRPQML